MKPEYIRKVKLKLEQPAIMCGGRKRVTCYYKGFVIFENDYYLILKFKTRESLVHLLYEKKIGKFFDLGNKKSEEWNDLIFT